MSGKETKKKAPKSGYEVGYCKPPQSAKWRRGESGNPSGRPKKRPSLEELFMEEADQKVTAKAGDQLVELTKMQAVIKATLKKAVTGHPQATKQVFEEYRKCHAALERLAQDKQPDFSWSEEHEKLLVDIKKISALFDDIVDEDE